MLIEPPFFEQSSKFWKKWFWTSTPQFNTAVPHKIHNFSASLSPHFNIKNPSVQDIPKNCKARLSSYFCLRSVFKWGVCSVELRGVLNWGVSSVELRELGLKRRGLFVWNWCVELRGVWNWGRLDKVNQSTPIFKMALEQLFQIDSEWLRSRDWKS